MSLIDDLRTLDPKQPGNWPWAVSLLTRCRIPLNAKGERLN